MGSEEFRMKLAAIAAECEDAGTVAEIDRLLESTSPTPSQDGVPPLPEPIIRGNDFQGRMEKWYSADQLRAYGQQCAGYGRKQSRQRAARVTYVLDQSVKAELAAYNAAAALNRGLREPETELPSFTEGQIDEYLADYEFRGDGGDYAPTETERLLIKDAILGLLADPPLPQSATPSAVAAEDARELTDERIDHIADLVIKGMPDGISGFCKSWGWRQFARAILSDCAGHAPHPAPAVAELSCAEGRAEFWQWLTRAYRHNAESDAVQFTRWNMQAAYEAGRDAKPAVAAEAGQGEREAFEVWAKPDRSQRPRLPDGGYVDSGMQCAWNAWHARAALATQPAPPSQGPNAARQDATRLRNIAAGLTYNDSAREAIEKHLLNEIAMRLSTGYYAAPTQPPAEGG